MKLTINKKLFLQSWNLAERSTSGSSSINILSSVLIRASFEEVLLQATDIRTSIICKSAGVTVIEPGEAVLPIKMVGDLFKKAPGEEFTLIVDEGKAVLKAGRSKYSFSTYPVREFPSLPSSKDGQKYCRVRLGCLAQVIDEGTLAASAGDEFPLYLSSANFIISDGILRVVSTDTKRLALAGVPVLEGDNGEGYLLPMKGIREVQRILASMSPDVGVDILFDDAQFYFGIDTVEFTVRRVESRFPPFEKILPKEHLTTIHADRVALISALERVDVIVRDYNRVVVMDIEPGDSFTMRGRAPDFGMAREELSADVSGEKLSMAVNSKFFMDALKVLREPDVKLSFNGPAGHMSVRRAEGDHFVCLIAPINLAPEELSMGSGEDGI